MSTSTNPTVPQTTLQRKGCRNSCLTSDIRQQQILQLYLAERARRLCWKLYRKRLEQASRDQWRRVWTEVHAAERGGES